MIEIKEKQVIATFGNGDIGVYSLIPVEDDEYIYLGCANQDCRKIGLPADKPLKEECSNDEFEILLKFDKIESVNVVIEQLEKVKQHLQDKTQ